MGGPTGRARSVGSWAQPRPFLPGGRREVEQLRRLNRRSRLSDEIRRHDARSFCPPPNRHNPSPSGCDVPRPGRGFFPIQPVLLPAARTGTPLRAPRDGRHGHGRGTSAPATVHHGRNADVKAIVQTKYGSADVLELREIDRAGGPRRSDARPGPCGVGARRRVARDARRPVRAQAYGSGTARAEGRRSGHGSRRAGSSRSVSA